MKACVSLGINIVSWKYTVHTKRVQSGNKYKKTKTNKTVGKHSLGWVQCKEIWEILEKRIATL